MDKALQTMIDNMPEKTGKSLAEWKSLLTAITALSPKTSL